MNIDKGFGIKMSEWLQQSIDANPVVLLNKNNALTKSVFLWSLLSKTLLFQEQKKQKQNTTGLEGQWEVVVHEGRIPRKKVYFCALVLRGLWGRSDVLKGTAQ